ncbi:hypothetical protein Dimus_033369 [Dionaea muscipula]
MAIGANRTRDDVETENEEEVVPEDVIVETDVQVQREENEEEQNEEEAAPEENFEWESVNKDAELQGEPREKEVAADDSRSGKKFYDAEEGETIVAEDVPAAPVVTVEQKKEKNTGTGVDPSGHLPDFDLLHLQIEFAQALQANTRFQELYQQMKSTPQPHQSHKNHLDSP